VKKSAKSRSQSNRRSAKHAQKAAVKPASKGLPAVAAMPAPLNSVAKINTAAWFSNAAASVNRTLTTTAERPPATDYHHRASVPRQPVHRPVATVRAATTYDNDDRGTVVLMMMPFVVIALSLGISQTVKPFITSLPAPSISARAPVITPVQVARPAMRATPAVDKTQRTAAWTPPALPWRPEFAPPPRIDTPLPVPVPVATAPLPRPIVVTPPAPTMTVPLTPPVVAGPAPLTAPAAPQVCERPAAPVLPVMGRSTVPRQAVGAAIATAAVGQTRDFVVYSAKYRKLSYPLGDLPSFYGACSDVVIRAYRTIGLDLQELVQRTRTGTGDTSIDHRRTETLRRFFTQYGESLAVTAFPEDYQPGDIVTYYRPFSRVSRAHIAVVSDVRAPTGRFMIVHNRGWGPQLEDALFVDRVTGHYRFDGSKLDKLAPVTAPDTAQASRGAVRQRPGQLSRASSMTPASASLITQR
jgi:uncharacterized protein